MAHPSILALAGAAVAAVAACNRHPTEGAADTRRAAAAADADGGPPRAEGAPLEAPPKPTCRAVSVDGEVREGAVAGDAGGGNLLSAGAPIPEDAWISLGRGGRMVAKDPRTTRETIFYGPGEIRACEGHREESWIEVGTFESERGAGEVPGAEAWIVTPFGVIRFATAKLRIDVTANQTILTVANGVALLWKASDADSFRVDAPAHGAGKPVTESGWLRVDSGALRIAPNAAAAAAVDRARNALSPCSVLATRSEELARALLAPHSGVDAGAIAGAKLISEQVSTRENARAACALAALRIAALGPSNSHGDLSEPLRAANDAWTALPLARPSVLSGSGPGAKP